MLVQRSVYVKSTYLVRRGGSFSFRFVLPRHVREICPDLPREVKRSLKTDSFPEALYLVSKKADLIRAVKRSRSPSALKRLVDALTVFDAQYDEVLQRTLSSQQRAAEGLQEAVSDNEQQPFGLPPDKPIAPRLSEVWDDFVQWKSWPKKQRQSNESMMETLMFFLGDREIDKVSRKDLKEILQSISKLPLRNRKEYKGKPLAELSQLEMPQEHRISAKYVKEHLKLCQSFFSSYLLRERELLVTSPTDGLRYEVARRRFASIGDSAVRHLLQRAATKPSWVGWFLYLAAYSGARRSEIAKLQTNDFKKCPDTGRYYFVIRGGKTKAASRLVPVHRVLEELGFLEWVSDNNGQLFPVAVRDPNRITGHFTDIMGQTENDLGERLVLHSLRHTFITKARSAGIETVLVQQVVGHEKTGAGVTDRYTHTFPFADTIKVVDSVSFE